MTVFLVLAWKEGGREGGEGREGRREEGTEGSDVIKRLKDRKL